MTKAVILYRKGYGTKSCPAMAELLGDSVAVLNTDEIPSSDWLIRWGVSSHAPVRKTINDAKSIIKSATKSEIRYLWAQAGIAPETFLKFNQFEASNPVGSWIVRPVEHSRSKDLTLCKDISEVKKAVEDHPGGFYISRYIKKTHEYRVFTAQGRVFGMVEKEPSNRDDISWGCISDGKFSYVPWSYWPKNVSEVAVRALEMTGLDFAAIDIIVDHDSAYVLETNTAPWCNSAYWQSKHVQIWKYMMEQTQVPFPAPTSWGWQDVIHPGVI